MPDGGSWASVIVNTQKVIVYLILNQRSLITQLIVSKPIQVRCVRVEVLVGQLVYCGEKDLKLLGNHS